MPITTVFVDLYQTLAYLHPSREHRQSQALKEFGVQVDEIALRRAYLAADRYYSEVNAETPVYRRTSTERQEIYRRYQELLLEVTGLGQIAHLAESIYRRYWQMERELRLYPDVLPTLAQLRESGYALGMITNVSADPTEDLERLGLAGRLDVVVASCVVGFEKPDPRIFRLAMEALRVEPSRAVHVGDQLLADAQGATSVGIRGILLDRYDLQRGQHPHRISSLTELAPLLLNGIS